MTSPGTKSSYSRPLQSFNPSSAKTSINSMSCPLDPFPAFRTRTLKAVSACLHESGDLNVFRPVLHAPSRDLVLAGDLRMRHPTRSTIERGRGCNKFVSVLRGNGTKIAPTGDICVQPPGEMSWIRGKLADHVGDHAVLFPEEVILVTSSGTELSHPRPSQSLNNSPSASKARGHASSDQD